MTAAIHITQSFRRISNIFSGLSRSSNDNPQIHPARPKYKASQGKVYLIGAGPGDPELLTIKAHRLIQEADVILIDWLVGEQLYDLFPKHAEKLFVGKKCGQHSMKQADINDLLIKKAQTGATVVRLKGGDPSIFGRLAEETTALEKSGVPFAVVPGVTAASGIAAYSGIPLTHRECAQSVKFMTAHTKSGEISADWPHLATDKSTLVFYMGLNRVADIQHNLIHHKMRRDMPIAVVDKGTSQTQRVVISTLQDLNPNTALKEFTGPALILIGEVVKHRQAVNQTMLYCSSLDSAKRP